MSQSHENHEGSKARRLVSLASQARKEFPLLYNDGRSLLLELRAQLSHSINTWLSYIMIPSQDLYM